MAGVFSQRVASAVSKIPRGKVATYEQVAKAAGSPFAYRAVGNVLSKLYRFDHEALPFASAKPLPCHRVIRKDGKIGGFAAGSAQKKKLLSAEGILFEKRNKISMQIFAISDQYFQNKK